MKLDLRPRCIRCNKLIKKNEISQRQYKRYVPFCSFNCQEWSKCETIRKYLDLKADKGILAGDWDLNT